MFANDRLGFVTNPLLRHSAERDHDVLARYAGDPGAATVAIAGDVPILRRTGDGATALLARSDLDRIPGPHEQVFLGTLEGRPVVAHRLEAEAANLFNQDPQFQVVDLRSVAVQGLVAPQELGILAQAKALFHWHATHGFCARCGSPSTLSCAGFRRDCPSCGAQHFPRTDPVAIMLITRGDRCLLGRQARFVANSYSCLAGFIEPGETIEDAVRRETFEEAGIEVGAVRYLASQPWPFPASLMIGCLGEALTETITLDQDELEDARWFSRADARLMLERRHPDGLITPPPMAIANHLLQSWVG